MAIVADAILDCTARGEIVFDAFLVSGTTLMAAKRVGRICFAAEIDPVYVDVAIRITSMVLNQRLVHFCRQTTPKTIQEMQTYAWNAKAAQCGEEKPLKIRDHGPDTFRYFAKSGVPYWRLGTNYKLLLSFDNGMSCKDCTPKYSRYQFNLANYLLMVEIGGCFRS